MPTKFNLFPSLFSALLLLLASGCNAQTAKENSSSTSLNLNEQGLALSGYDPVSYFQTEPLEGDPEINTRYGGAQYRFHTEANRQAFLADPQQYLPAYGGWCAYAIGKSGEKVSINPKTYKIRDGRLFLFYNAGLTNTLKLWNKEENTLLPAADENWKAFGSDQ